MELKIAITTKSYNEIYNSASYDRGSWEEYNVTVWLNKWSDDFEFYELIQAMEFMNILYSSFENGLLKGMDHFEPFYFAHDIYKAINRKRKSLTVDEIKFIAHNVRSDNYVFEER